MNDQERHRLFAELITRHQNELYGYIYAVVRNWQDSDDLYQAVCLVLWEKFDLFRPGSSFFAWARQTAKIEISDFLRRKQSPSHLTMRLREALAEIAAERHDDHDWAESYLAALRRCRDKLGATDEELLQLRYVEELGTREIAGRLHRRQPGVCRSLNRIRRWLYECIQMELARQAHFPNERS